VDDAGQLRAVQRAAAAQHQHDGCAGLLLLAEEAVLVGQRQVDARRFDGVDGADRAGQLAFQGALQVDALLRLRLAELGVVHQLEADHAGLGQAGGRQLQAHLVDLVGRDHDRGAARGELVGHLHRGQLGDDRAAFLVGQVGEQHAVVALRAPQADRDDDGHQAGQADAQLHLGARGHRDHAIERAGDDGKGNGGGESLFHGGSRRSGVGASGAWTGRDPASAR
jgi:hypothetical protein